MRANKCSHAFNVLLNRDVERLEEVCASFNRSSPVIDFMFLTFYSFLSTLELNDFLLITFIFLQINVAPILIKVNVTVFLNNI